MCSAMPRRIAVIGSSVSPGCGSAAALEPAGPVAGRRGLGRRGGGGAARCRSAAGAGAAGAAAPVRQAPAGCAPDSMNARMSFFVTRPPRPVPGTWRRVDAVLGRDARDDRARRTLAVAATAAAALAPVRLPALRARRSAAARLGARRGAPAGRGLRSRAPAAARRSRALAGAAPSRRRSRRARVPTSTVSPSWTRICVDDAAPGLGTSVSTLSVEISSSGSSASTCSPSCLSHLRDRALGDGDAHLRHDDVDCGSGGHGSS